MDITKIKEDKVIFEKILLAYWYSIPCDNMTLPDRVEITKDNKTYYNVNLIKNDVVYGMACMKKEGIDKYFTKLEEIKEHELDIIKRLEKEISDTKEKIKKKAEKRR